MEQLAGDRSNQKSGGSSYQRMRPLGPFGIGSEQKESTRSKRIEKSNSLGIHERRNRVSRDRKRPRKERALWVEYRTAER